MKTKRQFRLRVSLAAAASVLFLSSNQVALAGQPLETESARLLPAGAWEAEFVVETQHASEGSENAVPLLFEAGLPHGWQLTVEPVPYTSISPKGARSVNGPGDLEVTLTHLLSGESARMPAIALAAEVKVPTATNDLIGTGKTDYTVLGIASKAAGRFDSHVNLGYTFVGSPAQANLGNIIDYAVATEFKFKPTLNLVAEVIGNTSSTSESGDEVTPQDPQVIPEAAGGESSILIGARYKPRPGISIGAGLSYDNNQAFLVRTGVTLRFGRH